jgi:predicted regulator of Ras-like GTPase activity (Roadblock/LC7/MglB family)
MITEGFISETTQRLSAVLTQLQAHPEIQTAVLCTSDGLTVNGQVSNMSYIAATAGFLLSAAHQSSVLLGSKGCQEVTVHLADDTFLVCWPFIAGDTELILTVLFKQKLAYKRLLTQTIRAIQQAVEE